MKIKIILLVTLLGLGFSSCSKDEDESIIDCFGDSLLLSIHHSADSGTPRTVNFTMKYSGINTVSGIDWNFGDGKTAHSDGTTVSHTYTAAGTFTVKGNTTLSKSGGSCTVAPTKSLTVE